jgi:exosortase/archaeosortase family protein
VVQVWKSPAGRFLIRCPIITALVFVLPVLVPSLEPWLIHATIQSLAIARILAPAAVQVAGSAFAIAGTTIQIVPDCTPLFPTLLLAGGILAFSAPWRWKAVGVLAGAIVLWLFNMVRIYVLIAVLRFAPAQFDLVHVYLWQSVTLLAVVGCFLAWIRMSEPRESHA